MNGFIKKLRKKLSADGTEQMNQDEALRVTLSKVDPDNVVPVDDITSHIHESEKASKEKNVGVSKSNTQMTLPAMLKKSNAKIAADDHDDNQSGFLD